MGRHYGWKHIAATALHSAPFIGLACAVGPEAPALVLLLVRVWLIVGVVFVIGFYVADARGDMWKALSDGDEEAMRKASSLIDKLESDLKKAGPR